jgi:hypothetical protein
VGNSESKNKNSGGDKKATVPIAGKRKKSDEVEEAVVIAARTRGELKEKKS